MNRESQHAYRWGQDFAYVSALLSITAAPRLHYEGCMRELFRAMYGNLALTEKPTYEHKPWFETMLGLAEAQFPDVGRRSFFLGCKRELHRAKSRVDLPYGFVLDPEVWL